MITASFHSQACWRVVATRFPPVNLFETVADPEDFEALFALEAAFGSHANVLELLSYLPREQWVYGPGSGYIMAPFIYRNPGRFGDGSFGVFYAGLEEETAVREVAFHRERFLVHTQEGPLLLEQQILRAELAADFVDIREAQALRPELYDPDPERYGASQAWAVALRQEGHLGIAYASVRHPEGQCVAAFTPRTIRTCRPLRVFRYFWDGRRIVGWG